MVAIRRDNISVEELRRLLDYDPETGILRWRIQRGRTAKAGSVAGNLDGGGYISMQIIGRHYAAHRVIWALMTGTWPDQLVDHRDLVRSNNRWGNLRLAHNGQNKANGLVYRNSRSGVRGVRASGGKWHAAIGSKTTRRHLGTFDSMEAARAAYISAAKELYGEFARTE